MLNLLISSDTSSWESTTAFFERNRCLTEYIMTELKSRYSSLGKTEIDQIKQFPCIFAYEQANRKDAYIGYIRDISVRQANVMIDYELTGETIHFEDFINLSVHLDISGWELNRTHWTIKNVDIEKIRPFFSNNTMRKPIVFISYSWTPIENQRYVFGLVEKLTADGVTVIYDKKDLCPGQDKDYFMEHALTNHEIDCVLIVCNQDYMEKANARSGGVGYESGIILSQITSRPLQRKFIPVVFETNQNGQAYLPTFLKSRIYIDLTKENGYKDLLASIHNLDL